MVRSSRSLVAAAGRLAERQTALHALDFLKPVFWNNPVFLGARMVRFYLVWLEHSYIRCWRPLISSTCPSTISHFRTDCIKFISSLFLSSSHHLQRRFSKSVVFCLRIMAVTYDDIL